MPDPNELSARYARAVLDAFGQAIHAQDVERVLRVVTDDALVIGSESGEMGFGREGIRTFIQGVFTRYDPITWDWNLLEAKADGNHAWFFAEGEVSYGEQRSPYRASGVCVRDEVGEWRLAMFHGAAPE